MSNMLSDTIYNLALDTDGPTFKSEIMRHVYLDTWEISESGAGGLSMGPADFILSFKII